MILGAGAAAVLGVTGFLGSAVRASPSIHGAGTFSHQLPPLPYPYDALEPIIDEKTLRIHRDTHFAGYVKGLNEALVKLEKARQEGNLDAIGCLENDLAFHGSGVVLHWIYFDSLGPKAGDKPDGTLGEYITRDFGSFDAFWKQFAEASKTVRGSGWAILAWEPFSKRLVVLQAEKHQNLTSWGGMPLMACDLAEHAYYPKYQNRRGEYVDNFAKIIDWKKVEARLSALSSS